MDIDPEVIKKAFGEACPRSYREVVKALAPTLQKDAKRLLGFNHPESEDLVQDTLERMVKRRKQYDSSKGPLIAWTKKILYRLFLERVGSGFNRRETTVDFSDTTVTTMPGLAQQLQRPDPNIARRMDLERALQQLTPERRVLLLLVDYEGYTVRDAAALLRAVLPALTDTNANYHLRQARSQVRQILGMDNERELGGEA